MDCSIERSRAGCDRLIAAVEGWLAGEGIPPSDALALKLAAEELFLNQIEHGRGEGSEIRVELRRAPGKAVLKLTDPGAAPFDPDAVPPADVAAPLESRPDRGLGLHLVRNVVDSLAFRHDGADLTIEAVKILEGPVFDIRLDRDGNVRLEGRLEAGRVERARVVLEGIDRSCDVDCSDLEYISSAGLGLLIETQRRLSDANHALRITHLNPYLRELFSIAGFDHIFEIE